MSGQQSRLTVQVWVWDCRFGLLNFASLEHSQISEKVQMGQKMSYAARFDTRFTAGFFAQKGWAIFF